MKRFCVFLLILLSCFNLLNSSNFAYAKAERTTYAKVLSDCVFYKTKPLEYDVDDVYFIIPETYFVIMLEEFEDCFKVQYDRFVGYVEKDKVVIASFTPILKTLEGVTCDVKTTSGTQVWNKPSTNGDVLTTIAAGTENIVYIASAYGTIPSGGESNLWYYVSYTPSFNSTNVYEGYVYSENITNLSEIVLNAESNPEIVQIEKDENIFYISSSMKSVLIALIAIPIILLILIILYKITQFIRKNTNNNKFENNNLQGSDLNLNGENFYQEHNSNNLKENLNKMQATPFIRKTKAMSNKNYSYPNFPSYDSDDDLL